MLLGWVSRLDLIPVIRLTLDLQFAFFGPTIYRVMCECLETINHIVDAVDCFHDLESHLGGDTILQDEQWAAGELSSHILNTWCILNAMDQTSVGVRSRN